MCMYKDWGGKTLHLGWTALSPQIGPATPDHPPSRIDQGSRNCQWGKSDVLLLTVADFFLCSRSCSSSRKWMPFTTGTACPDVPGDCCFEPNCLCILSITSIPCDGIDSGQCCSLDKHWIDALELLVKHCSMISFFKLREMLLQCCGIHLYR